MALNEGFTIPVHGDFEPLINESVRAAQRIPPIKVKVDSNFNDAFANLSNSANQFTRSLVNAQGRVIAFGALGGVIFAVERAFRALIENTINVEKRMTEINVIVGGSTQTMKEFGVALFDVAKNTGASFDEVSKAALEFSRQGLGMTDTIKRTRDALILTRQTGLDAAESVNAITAAINSFSKAGYDSTTIINKLANVDQNFAVSTRDLVEAIRRVGSTATDAGVSLDQLVALVTSAQQITTAGGAKIGQAFKTIFTRLQSPTTINQLEELGVKVRDAQNNILPTIKVLENFAKSYDGLSSAQKSAASQLVGNLYQINILKASLQDLGKEYSAYQRALVTSATATDEAVQRNAKLNTTLATLLNSTKQGFTQLTSNIGGGAIAPAIRRVLETVNSIMGAINGASGGNQSEKAWEVFGSDLGKGLIKGLGQFLSGPGLALIGVALYRFLKEFGGYAINALKLVAGLNTGSSERAAIESKILALLQQEPALYQKIAAGELTREEAERRVLTLIESQTAALNAQAQVSARVAALTVGLRTSGQVALTPGQQLTTVKKTSKGYVPNFASMDEAAEIQGAIEGGYVPGKVKIVGDKMMNSAEATIHSPMHSEPAIVPPMGSKAGENFKKAYQIMYGKDIYGGIEKGRNLFQIQWMKQKVKGSNMSLNDPETILMLGKQFRQIYGSHQGLLPLNRGFIPNYAKVTPSEGLASTYNVIPNQFWLSPNGKRIDVDTLHTYVGEDILRRMYPTLYTKVTDIKERVPRQDMVYDTMCKLGYVIGRKYGDEIRLETTHGGTLRQSQISAIQNMALEHGKSVFFNNKKVAYNGYVPNFAYIPYLTPLIGKVATNVTHSGEGFGMKAFAPALSYITQYGYKSAIKRIAQDKPLYDISDLNPEEGSYDYNFFGNREGGGTLGVSDFAFRKMFGLEPRRGLKAGIKLRELPGKKNTYVVGGGNAKRYLSAFDFYKPRKVSEDNYYATSNNTDFGNYNVFSNTKTGKTRFSDTWDFELHSDEPLNIKAAFKELRERVINQPALEKWKEQFKGLRHQDPQDILKTVKGALTTEQLGKLFKRPDKIGHEISEIAYPRTSKMSYGDTNLTRLMRRAVSYVSSPLTFVGSLPPRAHHKESRLELTQAIAKRAQYEEELRISYKKQRDENMQGILQMKLADLVENLRIKLDPEETYSPPERKPYSGPMAFPYSKSHARGWDSVSKGFIPNFAQNIQTDPDLLNQIIRRFKTPRVYPDYWGGGDETYKYHSPLLTPNLRATRKNIGYREDLQNTKPKYDSYGGGYSEKYKATLDKYYEHEKYATNLIVKAFPELEGNINSSILGHRPLFRDLNDFIGATRSNNWNTYYTKHYGEKSPQSIQKGIDFFRRLQATNLFDELKGKSTREVLQYGSDSGHLEGINFEKKIYVEPVPFWLRKFQEKRDNRKKEFEKIKKRREFSENFPKLANLTFLKSKLGLLGEPGLSADSYSQENSRYKNLALLKSELPLDLYRSIRNIGQEHNYDINNAPLLFRGQGRSELALLHELGSFASLHLAAEDWRAGTSLSSSLIHAATYGATAGKSFGQPGVVGAYDPEKLRTLDVGQPHLNYSYSKRVSKLPLDAAKFFIDLARGQIYSPKEIGQLYSKRHIPSELIKEATSKLINNPDIESLLEQNPWLLNNEEIRAESRVPITLTRSLSVDSRKTLASYKGPATPLPSLHEESFDTLLARLQSSIGTTRPGVIPFGAIQSSANQLDSSYIKVDPKRARLLENLITRQPGAANFLTQIPLNQTYTTAKLRKLFTEVSKKRRSAILSKGIFVNTPELRSQGFIEGHAAELEWQMITNTPHKYGLAGNPDFGRVFSYTRGLFRNPSDSYASGYVPNFAHGSPILRPLATLPTGNQVFRNKRDFKFAGHYVPNFADWFSSITDLSQLNKVGSLGGSTEAQKYMHGENPLVVKLGKHPGHAVNEFVSNRLFNAFGYGVPDAKLINTPQGKALLTKFIESKSFGELYDSNPATRGGLIKGVKPSFAAHAAFANWDVFGDWNPAGANVRIDKAGKYNYVDLGGALAYRGLGAPKPNFGSNVPEINSLVDFASNPYAKASWQFSHGELKENISNFLSKTPANLKELLSELSGVAGSDVHIQKALTQIPARLSNLKQMAGYARGYVPNFAMDFGGMLSSMLGGLGNMAGGNFLEKQNLPANTTPEQMEKIWQNYAKTIYDPSKSKIPVGLNYFAKKAFKSSVFENEGSYIFGQHDDKLFIPTHFAPANFKGGLTIQKKLKEFSNVMYAVTQEMTPMLNKLGFSTAKSGIEVPFRGGTAIKDILVSDKMKTPLYMAKFFTAMSGGERSQYLKKHLTRSDNAEWMHHYPHGGGTPGEEMAVKWLQSQGKAKGYVPNYAKIDDLVKQYAISKDDLEQITGYFKVGGTLMKAKIDPEGSISFLPVGRSISTMTGEGAFKTVKEVNKVLRPLMHVARQENPNIHFNFTPATMQHGKLYSRFLKKLGVGHEDFGAVTTLDIPKNIPLESAGYVPNYANLYHPRVYVPPELEAQLLKLAGKSVGIERVRDHAKKAALDDVREYGQAIGGTPIPLNFSFDPKEVFEIETHGGDTFKGTNISKLGIEKPTGTGLKRALILRPTKSRMADMGTELITLFSQDINDNNATLDRSKYIQPPKAAKGFIPNFADALSTAISREIAAGVNPSQVRVSRDASLKNAANPMGFGVSNLRDEPGGLRQGIARAIKEGRLPSVYGSESGRLPNFAIQSAQDVLTQSGQSPNAVASLVNYYKALIEEFKSSGIPTAELNKASKELVDKMMKQVRAEELTTEQLSKYRESITKSIAAHTDQIRLLRAAEGGKLENQRDIVGRNLSKHDEVSEAYRQQFEKQLRNDSYEAALENYDKIRKSPKGRVENFATSFSQGLKDARNLSFGEFFENRRRIKEGLPLHDPSITPEQLKVQEDQAVIRAAEKRSQLINRAFILSYAAPILGGVAQQAIGDQTLNRRGASKTVEATTNAIGYGALAAQIGSRIPGAGLIVGGATLALSLNSIIKAFNDNLPDLEKNLERSTDKLSKMSDGFSRFISIGEQIKEVYSNPQPGYTRQLQRLRTEQAQALIQLPDARARAELLRANQSGNVNDVAAVAEKYITLAAQIKGAQETGVGVRKAENNTDELNSVLRSFESQILSATNAQGKTLYEFFQDNTSTFKSLLSRRENGTFTDRLIGTRGILEQFSPRQYSNLLPALNEILNNPKVKEQFNKEFLKGYTPEDLILERRAAQGGGIQEAQHELSLFGDSVFQTRNKLNNFINVITQQGETFAVKMQGISQRIGVIEQGFLSTKAPFLNPEQGVALRGNVEISKIETETLIQSQLQKVSSQTQLNTSLAQITDKAAEGFLRISESKQGSLVAGLDEKYQNVLSPVLDRLKQGIFSDKDVADIKSELTSRLEGLNKEIFSGRTPITAEKKEEQTFLQQSLLAIQKSQIDAAGQNQRLEEGFIQEIKTATTRQAFEADVVNIQRRLSFGGGLQNIINGTGRGQNNILQGVTFAGNYSGNTQLQGQAAYQQAQLFKSLNIEIPNQVRNRLQASAESNLEGLGYKLTSDTKDIIKSQIESEFPKANNQNELDKASKVFDELAKNEAKSKELQLAPTIGMARDISVISALAGSSPGLSVNVTNFPDALTNFKIPSLSDWQDKGPTAPNAGREFIGPIYQPGLNKELTEAKLRTLKDVYSKNKRDYETLYGEDSLYKDETKDPLKESFNRFSKVGKQFSGTYEEFVGRDQDLDKLEAQRKTYKEKIQKIYKQIITEEGNLKETPDIDLNIPIGSFPYPGQALLQQSRPNFEAQKDTNVRDFATINPNNIRAQQAAVIAQSQATSDAAANERLFELRALGEITRKEQLETLRKISPGVKALPEGFTNENLVDAAFGKRGDVAARALNQFQSNQLQQGEIIGGTPLNKEFGRGVESSAGFLYTAKDSVVDFQKVTLDAAANIKTAFQNTTTELITGTKKIGDAFREMGLNIANKFLTGYVNTGINSIFGLAGSGLDSILGAGGKSGGLDFSSFFKAKGGLISKYAGGGVVRGGSGVKDDVMVGLQGGEYIINKAAAQTIGYDKLHAMNSGGLAGYADGGYPIEPDATANWLSAGPSSGPSSIITGDNSVTANLQNAYLYNGLVGRPTGGQLAVDSNLSTYALTEGNNPQNALRQEREGLLARYLVAQTEYQKKVHDANKQYQEQLYFKFGSAIFGAATTVGGAYLNGLGSSSSIGGYSAVDSAGNEVVNEFPSYYGTSPQAPTPSYDYSNFPSTYQGQFSTYDSSSFRTNYSPYVQGGGNVLTSAFGHHYSGGPIRKFAKGGYNVPALLTGGEFVMSPQAVSRYGMGAMHELNSGRMPKYAIGGYVDARNNISTAGLGQNNDVSNSFSKLIEISAAIRDALQKQTQNTPSTTSKTAASGAVNNVTININVASAPNGQSQATATNSTSQTGDSNKQNNNSNKQDQQRFQQFAKLMQDTALQVIIREQRPGGTLYNPSLKSNGP